MTRARLASSLDTAHDSMPLLVAVMTCRADPEKWRQFGNDRPYHYYGSPWFFAQAGRAFGDAMVKLISEK